VGIAGKEKAAAKESGFGKDEGVIGFGFRQQPGPPEFEADLFGYDNLINPFTTSFP
jgi:hypothetical protein